MIILKIPKYYLASEALWNGATTCITYNATSGHIEIRHPVLDTPLPLPEENVNQFNKWAVYTCVVEPGFSRFIAIKFIYGIIVDATEEEVYEVGLEAFKKRIIDKAEALWLQGCLS